MLGRTEIHHAMIEAMPTIEKVVKQMEHQYHLQCMALVKQQVIMPSINLHIEIPLNPLQGCIYSLLEDQNHMLGRNLIIPNMNIPSKVSLYSGNIQKSIQV